METTHSNKGWIAGVVTALGASLCCITPIVMLAGGLGGAASVFGWIAPVRPYLIGATALIFGIAWYQQLKPQMVSECDCAVDRKPSFFRSKSMLVVSTVFAALMISFPYYVTAFHGHAKQPQAMIVDDPNVQRVQINIKGMTCEGCTEEINSEFSTVKGVLDYQTSYEDGSSVVTFDKSVLPVERIVRAVENTPYTVTSYHLLTGRSSVTRGDQRERISFYEVPLVCGADRSIGCGSRSKPALLELEKNPAIKEAWLNRPGTILAIVWKDTPQGEAVVKPILDRNTISYIELNEQDAAPHLESFRKEGLWYRGADVDQLSIEEAGTIAESSVQFAREHKLVTPEEAEKIKADVEVYFAGELVKLRTNDQLNYDSEHTFIDAIRRIAEKHIGEERTAKAMEFYRQHSEEESEPKNDCEGSGSEKGCCKK